MSDEALLAACASGDTAALGALFDRYYQHVYRFISRMSGCDYRDLDDLVQSAFLEVQRSAKRFQKRSSVRTWIFGIAANVVRHHVRSEARRKHLIESIVAFSHPAERSLSDEMEHRDELRCLTTALSALPHVLRVVFVMCDLEGIPGVEAARILDLRRGTLWRRLHEARQALAAAIARRYAR